MINIKIKLFLLGATLALFLLLRVQGAALITPASPSGIVSLELATSAGQTRSIVEHWKEHGLISKARQNILIDFLFIPFYTILFYTLAGSISIRMKGAAANLGVLLAFFSVIAGLLDVLENFLMLLSTYGWHADILSLITAGAAITKFSMLGIASLYILVLGFGVVMRRKIASL